MLYNAHIMSQLPRGVSSTVAGPIDAYLFMCPRCHSYIDESCPYPDGLITRCPSCRLVWHPCTRTNRIVIPSPSTPNRIVCKCVRNETNKNDPRQSQLDDLIQGGDNPDKDLYEEKLHGQMVDHLARRAKPGKKVVDPYSGDVAWEDYLVDEARKHREATLADIARREVRNRRDQEALVASFEYKTKLQEEEDAAVQAEVAKMTKPVRPWCRPANISGLANISGPANISSPANTHVKDPYHLHSAEHKADLAWEEYRAEEAREHRNAHESGIWNPVEMIDSAVLANHADYVKDVLRNRSAKEEDDGITDLRRDCGPLRYSL